MNVNEMQEIQILQDAIIAFQEGASDERRSALNSLQAMLDRKMVEMEEYEAWVDEQASIQTWQNGVQI